MIRASCAGAMPDRSILRILPVPSLSRRTSIVFLLACAALSSCARNNELDETGGIRITRSSCPAVAVPVYTGDVTLFDPPASLDARAIDVVATLTDLRGICSDTPGETLIANATFRVDARRSKADGAREVVLPYFATVMRGGTVVTSKRLGRVALRFTDGQLLASTTASASASVLRAAATLPADVSAQLTRKRRAQDADASIDPMSDPAVRAAVARASFELLIGFQLTDAQLKYNATR